MIRRGLTTLVVALAALALPSAALAAHVYVPAGSGEINYLGQGTEANALTVTLQGGIYTFTDPAAVITTGAGCSPVPGDPHSATCSAAGIDALYVDTAAENDSATIAAPTRSTMRGGTGADTLTGGSGPDRVMGQSGGDNLFGGDGDDTLEAEDEFNSGPAGSNSLSGQGGNDKLTGGSLTDSLEGGPGTDNLAGGGGDDTVDGGDDADALSGGDGNDRLLGGAGDDALGSDTDVGNPPVSAERGDDSYDGGTGNDTLNTGSGSNGGASDNDALAGGEGIDTLTYSRRGSALTVSQDGAPNDGAAGEADNVAADVETLIGGLSGDTITGADGAQTIDGGPGDDTLSGLGGPDRLLGGSAGGSDTIAGGAGDDLIEGDAGDDALAGDDGEDTLEGGGGTDSLAGGPANDRLRGGLGRDTLAGGSGNDDLDGGGPVLLEPDLANTLRGDEGDDTLLGRDGDDTLVGGPGSDSMSGGPGRDTADYGLVQVAAVVVVLDGKAGDGPQGENDNVQVDIENVRGGGNEDTFTGSDITNVLDSGSGEDYLDGKRGTDDLRAGAAADAVLARDSARDLITCGKGTDFVIADRGDATEGCEIVDRDPRDRPVTAKRIAVAPVTGNIGLGLPAAKRYVPLTAHANAPAGLRVDATAGTARLAAAGPRDGKNASGRFRAGAFKATQRRAANPTTDLTLTGGNFADCARAARGRAMRARGKSRAVRRLWGNVKGKFRTRGRYSTTTVRGTTYEVVDRCDGTFTKVSSGTVVVIDLVADRTVVLTRGESYLARAPR